MLGVWKTPVPDTHSPFMPDLVYRPYAVCLSPVSLTSSSLMQMAARKIFLKTDFLMPMVCFFPLSIIK